MKKKHGALYFQKQSAAFHSMGPFDRMDSFDRMLSVRSNGEEVVDDEPEYLSFLVDCRGRFIPPLPNNYFGNCMLTVVTESTNGTLRGNNGLLSVAEIIGGAIRKTVDSDKSIMDGYTKSVLEFLKRRGGRMLIVGGSPRLDFYGIDYGWGRPIKYETVAGRDSMEVFFLSKSRKYRGGIEIGVLMSKVLIDAFAAVFDRGVIEAKESLWSKM
ncbi:hypothetical protein CASFOL_038471 [Castilleja foliolosa]|uniref:Uncharacterized protein n=1 Tax=Castilleja foliolosa TaxID=1961234 RepID=A0ABD3BL18_9LAMI